MFCSPHFQKLGLLWLFLRISSSSLQDEDRLPLWIAELAIRILENSGSHSFRGSERHHSHVLYVETGAQVGHIRSGSTPVPGPQPRRFVIVGLEGRELHESGMYRPGTELFLMQAEIHVLQPESITSFLHALFLLTQLHI